MVLLFIVLLTVLVLPFVFRKVEENLELFLFLMGITATLVTGNMTWHLIKEALSEPIAITLAVLIAGALFFVIQDRFKRLINSICQKVPLTLVIFIIVVLLGLLSSLITAIVAAIILAEIIMLLPLARPQKIIICVIGCFSIGLGAVLTPLGEPLATIAVAKLNEDFLYLFNLLGEYILPLLIIMGVLGSLYLWRITGSQFKKSMGSKLASPQSCKRETSAECEQEISGVDSCVECEQEISGVDSCVECEQEISGTDSWKSIIIRALKVYLFVMALVFLGEGLQPLIDTYVLGLDNKLIYWLNMLSAVLDNATLAAAELSPKMNDPQIQAILMGLLVSGGMLIPGNIPNIISASKLKISMTEWAKIGVPLGLLLMVVMYFILLVT